MAFRKKLSRRASKKNFKRGGRIKKRNISARAMRGGIRL